jgi:filamentous hemagglutinin
MINRGQPRLTVDIRKFLEYVLIPNHSSGKDKVFLDILGYRPRNQQDATALVTLYIQQATEKFTRREYLINHQDRYGQRFTIEIEVRGQYLLTGWILNKEGFLKLATPFSGFARRSR